MRLRGAVAFAVLLLETASASPASDIARDVEWAAKQQQQTARAAAQHAAAQRAPAPQHHSVDMDQVIVQHFLRNQDEASFSNPPPPDDAFIKVDDEPEPSTNTAHAWQASAASPDPRDAYGSSTHGVVDLHQRARKLLKIMKEVRKITGGVSFNKIRSFRSHYLKELDRLKKRSNGKAFKKASVPIIAKAPVARTRFEKDQQSERAIKERMHAKIRDRMLRAAKYIGESTDSISKSVTANPHNASAGDGGVSPAHAPRTSHGSVDTVASSKFLQAAEANMMKVAGATLKNARLQREQRIAADEARHTAHSPAGLTPLAGGTASTGEGEGGGGGRRGEGEGEGDDAGSVADSTAGFLASHTFDPNSDPEVQWQLAGHGADAAGAQDSGKDAMATLQIGKVQHMIQQIGSD